MADKLLPLVICLDGEGEGPDHKGESARLVELYGQFGDWKNSRTFSIRHDFTTPVSYNPQYGDGRGQYLPHWIIGEHGDYR